MLSLFSGLFRWFWTREEMKLVILGIDNAGKTSILERTKEAFGNKGLPLETITPTIGLNLGRVSVENADAIFWDLGGQMALRGLWSRYYSECEGVLFVVDSTDIERMGEAKACLNAVLSDPQLIARRVPLVVMANKQDLTDRALDAEEVSKLLDLEAATAKFRWSSYSDTSSTSSSKSRPMFEVSKPRTRSFSFSAGCNVQTIGCSALRRVNIDVGVKTLVRMAKKAKAARTADEAAGRQRLPSMPEEVSVAVPPSFAATECTSTSSSSSIPSSSTSRVQSPKPRGVETCSSSSSSNGDNTTTSTSTSALSSSLPSSITPSSKAWAAGAAVASYERRGERRRSLGRSDQNGGRNSLSLSSVPKLPSGRRRREPSPSPEEATGVGD